MKIFISYSSVDRQHAFELMRLLEKQEGCDVWLDFMDIKPSEVLERELSSNLENADLVCLLLSPYSVSSKWVQYEAELTLKKKIRLLPIILRACHIPAVLNEIVGIDASAGILEEATSLRIIRAILGKDKIDETVLFDAGERLALAKLALQNEADKHLPAIKEKLEAIQKLPIRDISLTISAETFPRNKLTIIELQLKLNELWTTPMSFYFTLYKEGSTWPAEFGFKEPSYKEFFLKSVDKLDAVFSWCGRVIELSQVIDGTTFRDSATSFKMYFDGKKFHPKTKGVHLPQDFQIPSLFDLNKDNCSFKLIAHYPEEKSAEYIDQTTSDLDLTITAYFRDTETPHLTLFKSRHSRQQHEILGCQHLTSCKNEIEREVLLGLCPVNKKLFRNNDRKKKIIELIEDKAPVLKEDTVLAANYCFGEAQLAVVRNNHLRALQLFQQTVMLLEKTILQNYPTYDEGMLAFRGAENLLGYFIQHEKYERAMDFANVPYRIALRLTELYPDEPDYLRLLATASLKFAVVLNGNGDKAKAAKYLGDNVEIWKYLQEQLNTLERNEDYRKAVAQAISFSKDWNIETMVPLETWWGVIDPDGTKREPFEKALEAEKNDIPVWLEPPTGKTWETRLFESPLLRYVISVPSFYSETPEFFTTQMEVKHIFYGHLRHVELLTVSFMDKSTGGDMRTWVEAILAMTGFPVLEMAGAPEADKPKIQNWQYLGKLPALADRLELNEAHAYSGFAVMPPAEESQFPLGARLYIILARRGSFSWKVELVFNSTVFPGMPSDIIYANDHVRAASVFEKVKFG